MKLAGQLLGFGLLLNTVAGCHGCDDEHEAIPPATRGVTPPPAPPIEPGPTEGHDALPLEHHVRLARGSRGLVWSAPNEDELEHYGTWLSGVMKAAWSDRLPAVAPPPGFAGRLVRAGSLWMLTESPKRRRGSGLVIVRPSVAAPIIVEVPHSFFEPGTLELGLAAFDVLDAKALLVNTMHRGGHGEAEERRRKALSGESPMDVAHSSKTFFARAHEILLGMDPELVVIQLHGFADTHAPGVQVIVSAALTVGKPEALADALGSLLGRTAIRTYPDEIDSLGGTTNVQAKVSRRAKAPFYHVEMSATLRKRLESETAFRQRFAESLRQGVENAR